jgi:thiamine-phosphate pyrophosphorylase
LAQRLGSELVHNPSPGETDLPFSLSVHSMSEAQQARHRRAALVFVSPVHGTRSHPGQPALGGDAARQLAMAAGVPAIALGGMTAARFAALAPGAFHGWAAIDAWLLEPRG